MTNILKAKRALYIYWDVPGEFRCECCNSEIAVFKDIDSFAKLYEAKKLAAPTIRSHVDSLEHIKNHNIYLELHEKEEDKERYRL